MSGDHKGPSAMAHTPLVNVPVKAKIRSAIRPLSLITLTTFVRFLEDIPDPSDRNANPSLLNVIIRRTEYTKLKDKNKELEEQYRAISTSYAILCQDVKEVEAKNKDLEKRIKELKTRVAVEHSNGLEYARRERLLKLENERLKGLLLQMSGRVADGNDAVMNQGIK